MNACFFILFYMYVHVERVPFAIIYQQFVDSSFTHRKFLPPDNCLQALLRTNRKLRLNIPNKGLESDK